MTGSRTGSRLQAAALLCFSLALCLGFAEIVLSSRLVDAYYVWPPNLRRVLHPDPAILHGITGASSLTINSFGVRGREFSSRQRYRLLAVGGSTTICTYLDDTETWPALVEQSLNDHLGADTIWVGNVGRPGQRTRHHVVQVEKLLRQHQEIDAIVLLIGVNDMIVDLVRGLRVEAGKVPERQPSPSEAELDRQAFSIFPGWDEASPWYRRTAIGRWWTIHLKPRIELIGAPEQDERGEFVAQRRRQRQAASSIRRVLPNQSSPLAVYAQNVNEIIDRAKAEGVRVIFLTQPSLWRADLSRAERDLLWGGGIGPPSSIYYSVEALAEGMKKYNGTLLQVCRDRGVECIDLQSVLPRDATTFTDDVHFTELGARRVAEAVTRHLLETEPLMNLGNLESAPSALRREHPERDR